VHCCLVLFFSNCLSFFTFLFGLFITHEKVNFHLFLNVSPCGDFHLSMKLYLRIATLPYHILQYGSFRKTYSNLVCAN